MTLTVTKSMVFSKVIFMTFVQVIQKKILLNMVRNIFGHTMYTHFTMYRVFHKLVHQCWDCGVQHKGYKEEKGEDTNYTECSKEHRSVVFYFFQPGFTIRLCSIFVPHIGVTNVLSAKPWTIILCIKIELGGGLTLVLVVFISNYSKNQY